MDNSYFDIISKSIEIFLEMYQTSAEVPCEEEKNTTTTHKQTNT